MKSGPGNEKQKTSTSGLNSLFASIKGSFIAFRDGFKNFLNKIGRTLFRKKKTGADVQTKPEERPVIQETSTPIEEPKEEQMQRLITEMPAETPAAKSEPSTNTPLIQGEKLTQAAIDLIRTRGGKISGLETLTIQPGARVEIEGIVVQEEDPTTAASKGISYSAACLRWEKELSRKSIQTERDISINGSIFDIPFLKNATLEFKVGGKIVVDNYVIEREGDSVVYTIDGLTVRKVTKVFPPAPKKAPNVFYSFLSKIRGDRCFYQDQNCMSQEAFPEGVSGGNVRSTAVIFKRNITRAQPS